MPDARLLVASEWRQRIVLHAVDRHPANLESARDSLGALLVGGEHVQSTERGLTSTQSELSRQDVAL